MRDLLFSNLPTQKQTSILRRGISYNIMIVGPHGSGKTKLMNDLFGAGILPKNPYFGKNIKQLQLRSSFPPHQIISTPTEINSSCHKRALLNFQITEAIVSEDNFNINLCITEVDGVGDAIDNTGCWAPITTYLNEKHEDHYQKEICDVRGVFQDRRIHICLYMINAVNLPLKELDLVVMREISKLCNLIPVFTNFSGDAVKQKQIDEYFISENIEIFNAETKKPKVFKNKNMNDGECRAWSSGEENLNVRALRSFLFENNVLNFIQGTEFFYESFKMKKIEKQAFSECKWNEEEIKWLIGVYNDFESNEGIYIQKRNELMAKKKILPENKK